MKSKTSTKSHLQGKNTLIKDDTIQVERVSDLSLHNTCVFVQGVAACCDMVL